MTIRYIVWIPIVEQWTSELLDLFIELRNQMPWYVVQMFSSPVAGIKFIKEEWHTHGLVAEPARKGRKPNALPSIRLPGMKAFPFTRVMPENHPTPNLYSWIHPVAEKKKSSKHAILDQLSQAPSQFQKLLSFTPHHPHVRSCKLAAAAASTVAGFVFVLLHELLDLRTAFVSKDFEQCRPQISNICQILKEQGHKASVKSDAGQSFDNVGGEEARFLELYCFFGKAFEECFASYGEIAQISAIIGGERLLRSLPLSVAVLSSVDLGWGGSATTNSMFDFFSKAEIGLH
ncbi:hypothetical protein FEM48_Zijuj11G0155700 [Ziziphus jujuba var. spinosa]|uniref:Uncharacterized protein n=1 Tax=Ziziphus jujuba var. spinosa TaxID=714518 RepID=A0A978UJS7_ZIZJJ|nr:hypothetical protein FEM48_Zijuj11G0155700 [Ziziphus jujuba var. spinosa]